MDELGYLLFGGYVLAEFCMGYIVYDAWREHREKKARMADYGAKLQLDK